MYEIMPVVDNQNILNTLVLNKVMVFKVLKGESQNLFNAFILLIIFKLYMVRWGIIFNYGF